MLALTSFLTLSSVARSVKLESLDSKIDSIRDLMLPTGRRPREDAILQK